MISHKQRTLQNLKNGHIVNICIRIMDKYTRFRISGRINVEIVPTTGYTAAYIFAIILEVHREEFYIRFCRTYITDSLNHIFPLFHCRH